MKTVTSFWTTQFPRPADLPVAADVPSQVDVAIVGSGYTGLNAARVVAKSGAILCKETAVTHVKKVADGYEVQTNRGTVKAKEVVIATNGYTGDAVPALKPKIFPMGSYTIVTEPLSPELQQKLSPKERMFYTSQWFLNYFRITPDGRMLWGGRNNLSPTLDLTESASYLQQQMVEAFPDLADTPVAYSWGGQLGGTFDLMPHIGQTNGIHYAFGYSGHGLSIATYVGTEMGKLLTGEISRSPFAEIPEMLRFFYRGKPWFLPFAAWYFRFLDWRA